jgi:hypothetical protein
MKSIFAFFVAAILCISSNAASIELEWNMKDDTNVIGYSFTMWTESGVAVTTKLGKINSVKVDTLTERKRYIFQITPLNTSGGSGEKSNFIIYDVPSLRTPEIKGRPQLRIKPILSK